MAPDRNRLLIPALLAAAALALGACGSGDDDSTVDVGGTTAPAETTGTEAEPVVVETVDEPAPLPKGWKELINAEAGFSIGVPPGWKERPTEGGQGTILSSPDGTTVLTVTADRTSGALQLPLDEFAERTAEALGSDIVGSERFKNLTVYGTAPFRHTYEAVGTRAQGTPRKSGVNEKVLVVVLRREDFATYVVVDRETDRGDADSSPRRDTVKRIIRSIRGRPPA